MHKILPILVVAALVFAAVRFKWYEKLNIPKVTRSVTKKTQAQIKKTSNNILGTAVSVVQKQVSSAAANVNNFLDQKTQQILVGDNNGSVSVVTSVSKDVPINEVIVTIDFLQDNPPLLTFDRDKPYYLGFKNVPVKVCLFIDSQEYHVENGKLIKVSFNTSGNYQLSFNYCTENTVKFGEIVVK